MPVASFHEYARNLSDDLHETLRSGQAKTLALEVDQRSLNTLSSEPLSNALSRRKRRRYEKPQLRNAQESLWLCL